VYEMTEEEILALAEGYLSARKSSYILPGKLGERVGDKIEVIFLKPETLDPDIIIDPPDIRILVDIRTKEVAWVYQM